MPTEMSPVDVEIAFADFIRSRGGEVLQDTLGTSANFANADYLFRSAGVVAELKRLVEDKRADESIRAKINGMVHRWMNEGRIGPIYGTVQLQSKYLSQACQREIIEIFVTPLRRRILKANRQIRANGTYLSSSEVDSRS